MGILYLLQARPITAYIPLPPEMMTEPGERRILYGDGGLNEGVTMNRPMTPLTLDWLFGSFGMWMVPFIGPFEIRADGDPAKSLIFGAGGRYYGNVSQMISVFSIRKYTKTAEVSDALAAELLANIDEDRYRAEEKIDFLRWGSMLRKVPFVLWHARHLVKKTISAFWRPQHFIRNYKQVIDKAIHHIQQNSDTNLSLRALINKLDKDLTPVIGEAAYPALAPYMYGLWRLDKLFHDASPEVRQLVDSMMMGFAGNEAVDIGIRQYRMSRMLSPADISDLDLLAQRLAQRDLPADFLAAWDVFVEKYGWRGPGELELANSRYGDDPKLALEQISYMVNSRFDPEEMQNRRVIERKEAYEQLLQEVDGRKRRRLQRIYRMLDRFGPTRDTPKYLMVLDNGIVRSRALREGRMFVEQGRLDRAKDVFWLTLDEIDAANADQTYDLRQARDVKLPFYRKLDKVIAFPHLIDSRGRIGQVEKPKGDPNVLIGVGISRGVAKGRIKVLHTPRQKPIEKGDVLVAYTTDPGWTPLFVNAEAVLLEVGDTF